MTNVLLPLLLADKVALVTGGGSGIGAGIARLLAAHGARVALVGRRAHLLEALATEIRSAGRDAHGAPADVRDAEALGRVIDGTVQRYGGLDILINAAAGNFLAPAASLSPKGFRAVVDIDLCGTFNACRLAYTHLAARRGCVVSITAGQAFVPMPLQAHVGAAKAGIEKLTRDLALEWGPSGVRVNAVAPGPVAGTEGMARLAPALGRRAEAAAAEPPDDFERGAAARGGAQKPERAAHAPEVGERIAKQLPLGRFGTIDEVAQLVLFLCTPGAAWITGASFLIDGGAALLGSARLFEALTG
jgi:NAD(P)-dependent dehydrogenase (short-subunit alcohol dehydrogenase family)